MAGIGDLLGGGININFSQISTTMYVVVPIIVYAIMGIVSVFFIIWFKKFRFVVYVHSQRSDGKIIKKKTRGGFFTNRRTKVERLRIFSDLKAFIPPPPNRFIKREDGKDIIHILRTTGKEYIPMEIHKEEKYFAKNKAIRCEECKKDYLIESDKNVADIKQCLECKSKNINIVEVLIHKTDFQVHEEIAKDWFEIATNEDERKYSMVGWLQDNQILVIAISWGAVLLIGTMFIMGQVENAIKMGASVAATCTEQVARSIGLIPLPFIIRRFKKWK